MRYTDDFQKKVVDHVNARLDEDSSISENQICQELASVYGVGTTTVRSWIRRHDPDSGIRLRPRDMPAEMKRLREENRLLRQRLAKAQLKDMDND